MWTIGYIHYITNKIAYITYSHVDQDIPYQLKCNKGLFHAWDIIAVGLQEHIYNGIANYDIIADNDFLFKALDCFRTILVCVDDAFTQQLSEEQKQLMRAKDIIREAINNYPPEMPGIEDEYPPFCSIRIHRLLCEAESLLLNVAKKGNAEAQMLLADLYISAFETPQKKKGFFWLKKAVAQNYLPAIQMLREVNH